MVTFQCFTYTKPYFPLHKLQKYPSHKESVYKLKVQEEEVPHFSQDSKICIHNLILACLDQLNISRLTLLLSFDDSVITLIGELNLIPSTSLMQGPAQGLPEQAGAF